MVGTLIGAPPGITARQRQVVALIAAGCSNEEVAHRLEISPRTAKAHSDALRQKLGVPRPPTDPSRLPQGDGRRPAPERPGRPMMELPVPAALAADTGASLLPRDLVQSPERETAREPAMAGIESAVEAARR
jgi:hypothetical protein